MALVGMAVAGIAVGFFKRAFFGVDPFQCLCNGINRVIPIGFGTLYMIINAVLLVIDLFLDRHYIGISTFINLFLVGSGKGAWLTATDLLLVIYLAYDIVSDRRF